MTHETHQKEQAIKAIGDKDVQCVCYAEYNRLIFADERRRKAFFPDVSVKDSTRCIWELAVELAPEFCGKSYGSQAIPLFLSAVSEMTGRTQFRAFVEPNNYALQKCIENTTFLRHERTDFSGIVRCLTVKQIYCKIEPCNRQWRLLMKKIVKTVLIMLLFAAIPVFVQEAFAETCECGSKMYETDNRPSLPATCTESGITTYVCPVCGNVHSYEPGPLGHSYTKTVLEEPDCEEPGLAEYICSRCQDTYQDKLPPVGHDLEERILVQPTCEKGGSAVYHCSRCRYSTEGGLPPLGHQYLREETPATCTEDGRIVYRCRLCYSQYEQILKAEGHKFAADTDTKPTCTEEGEHTGVCTVCGETVTEKVPALGHKYKYRTTAPTCTEDGEKTGICSACGNETRELLPAPGHEFGDWVTVLAPTLFKKGSEERSCSVCGEKETDTLPKLNPSGKIITAAVVILGGAGAAFFGLRRRALRNAAKVKRAANGMITLKMSRVLLCLDSSAKSLAFEEFLKEKKYLDIKKPEEDSDRKKAGKPELVLFSADSEAALMTAAAEMKTRYPNARIGVVAGACIPDEQLNACKDSKTLFAWARSADSEERKLLRLIAPLYKPSEATGNYAENITLVTEALGLPILTAFLNIYVVGGDVKEAVQNRGMGSADIADMINDVAGMFGLDTLAGIAEAARVGSDQTERVSDKLQSK